jgi:hypothetical protein
MSCMNKGTENGAPTYPYFASLVGSLIFALVARSIRSLPLAVLQFAFKHLGLSTSLHPRFRFLHLQFESKNRIEPA